MTYAKNLPRSVTASIDADYFNSLTQHTSNSAVTYNTSWLYFKWCMHSKLLKGVSRAVMYIKRLFVKK